MTAYSSQPGLDPQAARVLAAERVPKFLATRNTGGIPNVVPVLSLQPFDDRTIVFGEMMIWKTRRNLEADPRLSVLIVSPDLRAWTVRGRFVEFQRSGPCYERVASDEGARYNPYGSYRSAGVIEVLSTTRFARFSQSRLLLDTLRCRLVSRSIASDGPAGPAMPPQVKEKFDRLKAVKAVATLDSAGHPDCLAGFPLITSGGCHLVLGGASAQKTAILPSGAEFAAAVLTLEPVAYQLKGTIAGTRRSLGKTIVVAGVREAYNACPPLPGKALTMTRQAR